MSETIDNETGIPDGSIVQEAYLVATSLAQRPYNIGDRVQSL